MREDSGVDVFTCGWGLRKVSKRANWTWALRMRSSTGRGVRRGYYRRNSMSRGTACYWWALWSGWRGLAPGGGDSVRQTSDAAGSWQVVNAKRGHGLAWECRVSFVLTMLWDWGSISEKWGPWNWTAWVQILPYHSHSSSLVNLSKALWALVLTSVKWEWQYYYFPGDWRTSSVWIS